VLGDQGGGEGEDERGGLRIVALRAAVSSRVPRGRKHSKGAGYCSVYLLRIRIEQVLAPRAGGGCRRRRGGRAGPAEVARALGRRRRRRHHQAGGQRQAGLAAVARLPVIERMQRGRRVDQRLEVGHALGARRHVVPVVVLLDGVQRRVGEVRGRVH
jgi:hypothetical protein